MITTYIQQHMAEFWFLVGVALLVLEITSWLTSGVLLFNGIGAIVTAILLKVGILPDTWIASIASVGFCSAASALMLWKPLKRFQDGKPLTKDNSSDLIGYSFVLTEELTALQPGKTRYSGIDWKVILDKHSDKESIPAGQWVVVTSVDAGKMYVDLEQK